MIIAIRVWIVLTMALWLPFILVGAFCYCVWWAACAGYHWADEAMK